MGIQMNVRPCSWTNSFAFWFISSKESRIDYIAASWVHHRLKNMCYDRSLFVDVLRPLAGRGLSWTFESKVSSSSERSSSTNKGTE